VSGCLRKLSIVGAGGHGVVTAEAARLQGKWSTIDLYDDDVERPRDLIGFTLSGTLSALRGRVHDVGPGLDVIVGLGGNDLRMRLTEELLALGGQLATVIHPSAIISPSASVGPGTVILAGAIIGSRAVIGRACIINSASVVEHDCRVADGVHLAPRSVLGGGASVGKQAWLGVGATVAPGLRIALGTRIDTGTAVLRSLE
jgi:sugar O-acyltransferase (sialic acid O-acetyltransferase NeuD family)